LKLSLNEQLAKQLDRDEANKLKMYRDSRGILSIGRGHNLEAKPISTRASDVIFDDDIEDAKRELFKHLPWTADLDEARQGVLLNMTFNMGVGGLLAFEKTLAFVQAGQYSQAADEMMKSKWAFQVGDGPGLKLDRAERLAIQMREGIWQ
jgi:lysozyme